VLKKKPVSTVIIIAEVDMDNWGLNSESATARRNRTSDTETGKS